MRHCAAWAVSVAATIALGAFVPAADAQGSDTPSGPPRLWLALGDSYSSGEGIPGAERRTADGRDCERATGRGTKAKAWSVSAYDDVRQEFGFSRIDFVACTGARTDDIESQIDEAGTTSGSQGWDMVTLGIGGNNIRFADVLRGCIDMEIHWDDFLKPGCDEDPARLRARVDMLTGKRKPEKDEYDGDITLPQVLDRVAARVNPGGDVVVTGYPQLVEEVDRWEAWRRTILPNCEGIQSFNVGDLRGVTGYLNEQIGVAVQQADARNSKRGVRFHFVDIAHDPYEFSDDPRARHALCAQTPWLNGLTPGIDLGGRRARFQRSFHPMQVGHRNTGRVVATLIRKEVRFDDAPSPPTPPRPERGLYGPITAEGIAPVRVGMTRAEADAASHVHWVFDAAQGTCGYLHATPGMGQPELPAPIKAQFMITAEEGQQLAYQGTIARVDVHEPGFATQEGIGVGDSVADLERAYGSAAKRTPHAYVKGYYYSVIPDPSRPDLRIVFETERDKVIYIRAGRLPEVDYIEGCS